MASFHHGVTLRLCCTSGNAPPPRPPASRGDGGRTRSRFHTRTAFRPISWPAVRQRNLTKTRRRGSANPTCRRCISYDDEKAACASPEDEQWVLRRAVKGDTPRIEALQLSSREEDQWTGRKLEEEFENDLATIMLAESKANEEQRLLGMGIAWHVAGETQVLELLVAKEARRRGVGAALLKSLCSVISSGKGPVLLEVRASNDGAIALYRKLGLMEVGRRKGYYSNGEDAVLMNSA